MVMIKSKKPSTEKKKGKKITELSVDSSNLLRIVLDTPKDTHMFCSSDKNVLIIDKKGTVDSKKAKDLLVGDYIKDEGEVLSIKKI